MAIRKTSDGRPQIVQVKPEAAIAGGELLIQGKGFARTERPRVTIGDVAAILDPRPLFIADGHHRYETACNYRDWLAQQGPLDAVARLVRNPNIGTAGPNLGMRPDGAARCAP